MGCCGGDRGRGLAIGSASSRPAPSTPVTMRTQATVAVFRYEGSESLTVIGRITGRKYWFEKNGSEIAVELRDRASVAQVSKLRELRLA